MKQRYILLTTLISIILGGCAIDDAKRTSDHSEVTYIEDIGDVYNGNVVVKMKEEVPQSRSFFESYTGLEVYSVNKLFPTDPRFEKRHKEAGLHLWYHITFNPDTPITRAYQDLTDLEEIEIIEFLPKIKTTQIEEIKSPFNDPSFDQQWSYHNFGQKSGFLKGADINLINAWGIESGDSSVIVAIIDGGVDYSHEDLADAMWVNKAEFNGERGVDDDGNGYIDDIHGYNFAVGADGSSMKGGIVPDDHGTHVAGVVGAINNNGKFGSGIAGGNGIKPGVKLMSCQTIDGKSPAYIAAPFVYAADNGAVITQNSWSTTAESSTSLTEAINYFNQYAGTDKNGNQTAPMKGGVTIFAAGNDNVSTGYPGSLPYVIGVAATGPTGEKASYSNYGDWVDISAPGGEIDNNYVTGDIYSTVTNNGFQGMSGTSMACPHVSGVAALIVSRFGGEGFTSDMLWSKLLNSADSSKLYNQNSNFAGLLGKGSLDAFAALYEDNNIIPDVVTDITVEPYSNQLRISWPATETGGRSTFGYNVYLSEKDLSDFNSSDINSDVKVITVLGGSTPVGESIKCKITALKFNTEYFVRIGAITESNKRSELSAQIAVSTTDNISPVITPNEDISVVLKSFESTEYTFDVVDLDEHNWSISFTGEKGGLSGKIDNNKVIVTIDAKRVSAGTHDAQFVVTDEFGGESSVNITYQVLPNTPPALINTLPNLLIPRGETEIIDLSKYINDADGELLTYTVSSSSTAKIVDMNIDGTMLSVKGNWYGSTTVSVKGSDHAGSSMSTSFEVLIRDSSIPVDIFPSPVIDNLNIRTGSNESVNITITSALGSTVYQVENISVGPFNPLIIDATTWSSGIYSVEIVSASLNFQRNIVKL